MTSNAIFDLPPVGSCTFDVMYAECCAKEVVVEGVLTTDAGGHLLCFGVDEAFVDEERWCAESGTGVAWCSVFGASTLADIPCSEAVVCVTEKPGLSTTNDTLVGESDL